MLNPHPNHDVHHFILAKSLGNHHVSLPTSAGTVALGCSSDVPLSPSKRSLATPQTCQASHENPSMVVRHVALYGLIDLIWFNRDHNHGIIHEIIRGIIMGESWIHGIIHESGWILLNSINSLTWKSTGLDMAPPCWWPLPPGVDPLAPGPGQRHRTSPAPWA